MFGGRWRRAICNVVCMFVLYFVAKTKQDHIFLTSTRAKALAASHPAAAPTNPPTFVATARPAALPSKPASSSFNTSTEKVENVVKLPQKPTPMRRVARFESPGGTDAVTDVGRLGLAAPYVAPRIAHPKMLTAQMFNSGRLDTRLGARVER